MQWVRSPWRVLLLALLLGGLAQALFYKSGPVVYELGISVLIFVVAALIALFGLAWLEKVKIKVRNLWLITPLLFFAALIFIRANPLLAGLNTVAVIVLFCLLLFFLAADNLDRLGVLGYPVVLLLTMGEAAWKPVPLVATAARSAHEQRHRVRVAVPVLRGLALAVPALLVFTFLLASADSIFADFTAKFFKLNFITALPDFLIRLALALAIGWIMAGSLLLPLNRRRNPNAEYPPLHMPGKPKPAWSVGFVEAITILTLLDFLFLVFAWFQFNYLFSGNAVNRLNYAAYRDYVREGFGQLLLASFLTLALICGLLWYARRETPVQATIFNLLCSVMIALAGVMLVSAFWRMLAWENVEFYINTPTRLYVRSFILWLGLLFVWQFITLWTRPEKFAIGAFVAALGFLITVNLANPDADVAEYNLGRYAASNLSNLQNSELAYRYLYELSDDAVPILVESLDRTGGAVQQTIKEDLRGRLIRLESNKSWENFAGFNLSHFEAYRLLDDLRKAGRLN